MFILQHCLEDLQELQKNLQELHTFAPFQIQLSCKASSFSVPDVSSLFSRPKNRIVSESKREENSSEFYELEKKLYTSSVHESRNLQTVANHFAK